MSEQEQVQTQEQVKEEGQQELILGKFKSQDDLIASYQQLEKKLHSKPPQQETPKQGDSPQETDWREKNAELDAQETLLAKRKQEANAALTDGDTLQNVRMALGSKDAIDSFQKDFDAGHVSAAEVQRLASLAKQPKENPQTIPEPQAKQEQVGISQEDEDYMMGQFKNLASPYNNSQHPEHRKARARVAQIQQTLNNAVGA